MVNLLSLKPGTTAKVIALETKDDAVLRKLLAMGISPGVLITLEQRFPSYIIRANYTRAALDRETAAAILVQVEAIPQFSPE